MCIIIFLFYNWLFTLLFIGFSAFAADVITSKITGFSVEQIKLDEALKELSTTIFALVTVLIFVFLIGASSFEPLTPYQRCLNSKERYRGVSDEIHKLQCRRDYDRK